MLIDSASVTGSMENLSNFTYDKLSPDALAQRKAGLQKKRSQIAYDQDKVEMGSFGGDDSYICHPVGSLGDSKNKFHFVHDQSPNKMITKQSIPDSPIDSNNNNSIRNIKKANSMDSTAALNLKPYQLMMQNSILETQQEDEDDNADGLGSKIRLTEVQEETFGYSQPTS